MSLPDALQSAIEKALYGQSLSALTQATQEVSSRYRQPASVVQGSAFLTSEAHRLAYLTTRLPATYAVVRAVLHELTLRAPDLAPASLLDVGAGPGTAMWAAVDAFSSLRKMTLLEQDGDFLKLGQQLASSAEEPAVAGAQWIQRDMTAAGALPIHDLVLLSYSIGEIGDVQAAEVLRRCFAAAALGVVVIEPGTPRGYKKVMAARDVLLQCGGRLIAPCPHAQRCPMLDTDAWCHFPCRVSRTSAHRVAKEGLLGYEDEKYSYVIVTKDVGSAASDRVVGHPSRKSGHVHIELCTADNGIQRTIISKKQGDAYRWARRAEWGDSR